MAAALPASLVLAPAARKAARTATEALTTPIYGRTTTMRWNREEGVWEPDTQQRNANITPAALLGLGAVAAAAGTAAWLMGVRARPVAADGPERQQLAALVQARQQAVVSAEAELARFQAILARVLADLARAGIPPTGNRTVLSLLRGIELEQLKVKARKQELRQTQVAVAKLRAWPFHIATRDQFVPGSTVLRLFTG